jgi:hypothetical protein
MSLTVRGSPCASAEEAFEQCHLGRALGYALELKQTRYSYHQVADKGETIGTLDATSCLGVIYRTPDHATYVQHHDGRPLHTLLSLFDKSTFCCHHPVEVTLVGGCKIAAKNGLSLTEYPCLEKQTKENLKKLVYFWQEAQFHIDIQGWAIGDGQEYTALCSDLIVDREHIYLMKQGELGSLNLKMGGALIPHASHRLATILLNPDHYFFVYDSAQKMLVLSDLDERHSLKTIAQMIMKLDDKTLLKKCSTTPEIEPPYFPQMMRNMASYVLKGSVSTTPLKTSLPPNQSTFAIQGEIVKLATRC